MPLIIRLYLLYISKYVNFSMLFDRRVSVNFKPFNLGIKAFVWLEFRITLCLFRKKQQLHRCFSYGWKCSVSWSTNHCLKQRDRGKDHDNLVQNNLVVQLDSQKYFVFGPLTIRNRVSMSRSFV